MRLLLFAVSFVLLFAACTSGGKKHDTKLVCTMDTLVAQPTLPVDVQALIDTLNRGKLSITDTALAMKQVNNLLEKYRATNDSFAYYNLIQQKARNYLERNETDSLIRYATIGLEFFERQDYYSKWPLIDHYRLAVGNIEQNHFKIAIFHATKTRLETENPAIRKYLPPGLLIKYLFDLANICEVNQYYEDAGKNIDAAINLTKELTKEEDKILITDVYGNKAALFLEQAKPDSALPYIRKAQANLALHPSQRAANWLDRSLGSYFSEVGMLDSAIIVLERQINTEKSIERKPSLITLKNLSNAYMCKGNMGKASEYIQRARTLLANNPNDYDARDSNSLYNQLIEYNILAGTDKKTAHADFLAYLNNTVEYVNEQHIREVNDMEGRYRLKNKEQDIALLNANARESRLELKQKTQLIWLGFGTSILVLLLSLWAYSLQRQRILRAEKEKLQQQIAKVQLEQRLLRTQMEPHFIFNSLAVMQSFIREGEDEKSIRYISTFAKLLRQSLEHSREPLVSLSKELNALENYLQLQQMRFENLFDYTITCAPELLDDEDLRIPPMMLQPFTENCIQHGFTGINHKGLITISIIQKDHSLLVKIGDNGKGITPKSADKNPSHQSLSTRITRERLGMLSADTGVQSDLRIVTNELQGTLVELIVPLR